MKLTRLIILFVGFFLVQNLLSQTNAGFFLDSWKPRNLNLPEYTDVTQTSGRVNVSVKIDVNDTVTKVSNYIFGDNANAYTSSMSDNPTLMGYMADRDMGVLRGPSGSISDVYFWNRYDTDPPTDVPKRLAGATSDFGPWYGKRQSWANWSMDVDSFYRILSQVKATGMITVNYGYARYGTSDNPVAKAAHLAADWVRYDKGRSRFWEIGNEVFGSWEAGYRIDKTLNKDNQPEYINGTIYGKHCLVFIDSMKKAAAEIGVDIKIGVVLVEENNTSMPTWNDDVFNQVADKTDFYVIHSYFTPYNQNSTASVILNSYSKIGNYRDYIWNALAAKGKPKRPIALTEYNIFAVGSMQAVSHINALHAPLVMGEGIRTGLGAALRWDLANGWDNGNDHGMFSYGNEPNVEKFSPRPAFYSMYMFRKYFGDVMVKSTVLGSSDIVVFSSRFSSGQVSAMLINKGNAAQTARINVANFKFGQKYYTYTLTGGTDNGSFSRKIYINSVGPAGVAGGPLNYKTIKANASIIDNEIKVEVPAYSMVVFVADKGEKSLVIDETFSGLGIESDLKSKSGVSFYPVPAREKVSIATNGQIFNKLEIIDLYGKTIQTCRDEISDDYSIDLNIPGGLYLVKLSGENEEVTGKILKE